MTDRNTLADQFLTDAGWANSRRSPLAGDASNRRYERVDLDGKIAVLMDAPAEKGEDVRPFIHITKHLRQAGLSAPEIFASDCAQGFLLLEDLGDDLFARIVLARPEQEQEIYIAAADVLIALHAAPLPELATYDADIMTQKAALAYLWYQRGASGQTDTAAQARFKAAFRAVLDQNTTAPPVLIQRDYHAENLLWLPRRRGVARVGLLDYQDAMAGDPAYDLVSLLQDARRDVPPATEARIIAYYLQHSTLDAPAFRASYAVLGAQRNLRILGVFSRLCMQDGKAHYVDFIPRVWDYLIRDLAHPALSEIAAILLADLPAPTAQNLKRLKEQCAQNPKP